MRRRTVEDIAGEIIAYLAENTALRNFRPLGTAAQLIYAFAQQVFQAEEMAWRLRDARFVDTAPEEDLDALAREYTGEGRRGPTKARGGAVVFSRENVDSVQVVPAGTLVARKDGFQYETLASATLDIGERSSSPVPVVARRAGTVGNCDVGAITKLVTPIQGITGVTNTEPVTGGEDVESVSSLRERIRIARSARNACTFRGIEAAIRSINDPTYGQIAYVRTVPDPGNPVVYISDSSGLVDNRETVAAGEVLIEESTGFEPWAWLDHWPVVPPGFDYVVARDPDNPAQFVRIPVTVFCPWGLVLLHSPAPVGWRVETALPYQAWTGLVRLAQARIDGRDESGISAAPAGIPIAVRPARREWFYVTATVICRGDPEAVKADLLRQLPNTLNQLGIGDSVKIAAVVAAIMRHPQVVNCSNVTLNGQSKDLVAPFDVIYRTKSDNITLTVRLANEPL